MNTNWDEYKLGDISKFKNGVNFSASSMGTGIPLVNVKDITNPGFLKSESLDKVNIKIKDDYFAQEGDIFFARSSVKREGIADVNIFKDLTSKSTHCGFIIRCRLDKKIADPLFCYYYFKNPNFREYIRGFSSGTAIINISQESLKFIKIYLPPLKTQQKIAKILSNYDDLIENNLKRIKLLEESARLTYEEWFLRFRIDGKKLEINPESGLPFGWQDVLLTDYIDLLRGVEPGSSKYKEVKTDSNIPFIRVGDLSKRDSDIYVSKDLANNKIIDKDDILLSLDGSPGKVRFGLSGCYSTGIRKAVSKQKNVSSIFIYNLLNSSYIQGLIEAYATGATILHAGSSVKKMRLILPTDEVLDKYNNIEMKKFQLILNLSDEIKLLKEAREILLPRLMTGMIDTDDMDIAV